MNMTNSAKLGLRLKKRFPRVSNIKTLPIVLSAELVRGVLSGRVSTLEMATIPSSVKTLWVRESFFTSMHSEGFDEEGAEIVHECPFYPATENYRCGKKRKGKDWPTVNPPCKMPRRLSRITLRVTQIEPFWEEGRWLSRIEFVIQRSLGGENEPGKPLSRTWTYSRNSVNHLASSVLCSVEQEQ